MAMTAYLLRDEYIESRNVQDHQIKWELDGIRNEVSEVKVRLDRVEERLDRVEERLDRVEHRLDRVEHRLDRVEERLDRIEVSIDVLSYNQRRSTAWLRNQMLSNPTLPIQPVVVRHPTEGVIEPDPRRFPRNAKMFYALRSPVKERQKAMLHYLVSFYDVQVPATASSSSAGPASDDSDDDSDDDVEAFTDTNHHAIHILEGILGLCEDNFESFAERARARAQLPRAPPPKRNPGQAGLSDAPLTHRPFQVSAPVPAPTSERRPLLSLSDIMRYAKTPSPPPPSHQRWFVEIEWKEDMEQPSLSFLQRQWMQSQQSQKSEQQSQKSEQQSQQSEQQPEQPEHLTQPTQLLQREDSVPPNARSDQGDSGSPTSFNTNSIPSPGRIRGRT